ncbi:hypothetical protein M0G43_03755 [Subsaxibacter sp. CAU 1640]|uniref:MORN repeat-containing protein n=1 Tax=Subsaxibacter sp. CAU 1640 TaxID=2933271 RepID=UPI0020059B5C|nr:hypothetical protein [Subsaxibacter sp. CAU 1640]MCK7589678.1 hypothetical protein [Subsaxibacter sp. CAU 1640]
MKQLALALLCAINLTAFSQQVDWVNAPMNPIAFAYKLEHFQLKGDVAYYNGRHFDTNGLMVSLSNYADYADYFYENGKLAEDSNGSRYNFNDQGYISYRKNYTYEYDSKGYLTAEIYQSLLSGKKVETITRYSYDTNNRLIKKENFTGDKSNYYYTYVYKKVDDILQVTEERFEGTVSKWKTYYEFKNGRKILAKENNSDIVTKIEYKFDSKGNTRKVDYIQSNGVHDSFDDNLLYHSQANNSKITLDNSENKLKVFRNGELAYDIERATLKNKKDILLYEALTKTYYKVNDIYGDNPNKQKNIIPQKMSQGQEAMAHLLDNKVDIYFRGSNIFGSGDILKPISIYNALVVYHLPDRTYINFNYLFENFKLTDNSFFPGQILPPSSTSVFYAKKYDGLVSTYKFVVNGVSIADKMKAMGYLKGDVDMVVERQTDKQLFVLDGYANAINEKVYQGRYYDKASDGDIVKTNSEKDTEKMQPSNAVSTTTSTTNNTNTLKTGCISGNCTDGYGIYKYTESTVEGFFSNGKPNGFGIQNYETGGYEGELKDGSRDGFGLYAWDATGANYVGYWKDGKQQGLGMMMTDGKVTQAGVYEDGKWTTDYASDYKKGVKSANCEGNCDNGFGIYTFSDGGRYMGLFKDSKMNGVGLYFWPSGASYFGVWSMGVRTGQGQYYYTDGKCYKGNFANNLLHGLGVYYNADDTISSKGYWENNALKTSM